MTFTCPTLRIILYSLKKSIIRNVSFTLFSALLEKKEDHWHAKSLKKKIREIGFLR